MIPRAIPAAHALALACLFAVARAGGAQTTDTSAAPPRLAPDSSAFTDSTRTSPIGQEWASIAVGGLGKQVEVELYGTTRTASPGGLVVIRYSVNSFEDQDERVRLRLRLPLGWTLLDPDIEGREMLLESWENLEGEIRVAVPADARAGERQRVHVSGEVIGEAGSMEVYASVQVVRRGGLKPGDVGLTGTTSVRATNFAMADLGGARLGGAAELNGRLTRSTTLSLDYRQGPREDNLTNYRIAQEETRWNALLRSTGWTVQAGNQVSSYGNALTGPSVRGQGGTIRRSQGRLVGDLTLLQPTSYFADPGGHLFRGGIGWSGSAGRVSVTASDFARPTGGYSVAPLYPQGIDPDSLEKLERERRALADASRNRVRGAGLDVELRPGSVHRVTLRGGWLELLNAQGDTVRDPSVEVGYSLMHPRLALNARMRRMPNAIQGILLPGDELSVDGSVRVIGEWRLAGRSYTSASQTVGNSYRSDADGWSYGIRWYRSGWQLDARRSYRSWSYGQQPTEARTVTLAAGAPLGPLNLTLFGDVGTQEDGVARRSTASYRTDLRWSGRAGMASWSTGYYETLNAAPRVRTDLLGTVRLGEWELAGGAWATHGMPAGGEPGMWTQIGVPVTYDLLLSLGVEHAPPTWGATPAWLGTIGIRKKVAIAIPFVRDPTAPPPSSR